MDWRTLPGRQGVKIKASERVLIAGKTGSGKTWLARRLLARIPRLVVIDPKSTLADWNLKEPSDRDWNKFDRGEYGRYRIQSPVTSDLESWYDDLFGYLYECGELTIYIDEAYAVTPPGQKPGKWLSACYTRGREKGIGVWSSTQRPAWIPLFMLSEADWFLVFRLSLEQDRKRIAALAGDSVMAPIPDPHGLWRYHIGDESAMYFSAASERVEQQA